MEVRKVLILTDHRSHSKNNSLYTLARGFKESPGVEELVICSRGVSHNKDFFEGDMRAELFGKRFRRPFNFEDMQDRWAVRLKRKDLNAFDLIILRLPRPVPDEFFDQLEQVFDGGRIINRPSGIKKTSSKAYLLNHANICPPMKLVHSPQDGLELASTMDVVFKPLKEYGGKGLLKIEGEQLWVGKERQPIREFHRFFDPEGMLAMQYLSRVQNGDKRTVVVNEEILFSTIRFPPPDSWLCNVSQGGRSEISEPTTEEKAIAAQLSPALKREGVLLFGFDTLENEQGKRVLSEINSLSIGGIAPAEEATGKPFGKKIAQKILQFVRNHQ